MAMDLKWILSAEDKASPEFEKVGASGEKAGSGISSAFDSVIEKLKIVPDAIRNIDWKGINDNINTGLDTAIKANDTFRAWDETLGIIKSKIAIWGIAVITGISAVILTGVYAVYKATDFIVGLFTGESYKSKSIDAVIAVNNEVKDLQKQLQLTAVDANAVNDALSRIGVDKGDYSTVYKNAEVAIRGNKEELDRLGIAYKKANGEFLAHRDIVQNAKNKLDEYTAGWDRNQAATAIGLGTYEQINNYLKVTQGELQKSKERLDEYNLGIGTDAQKVISDYETAMREFNNELKLMGQGFKRAWSDQIMPAFTAAATLLKDGWPVIVNAFRYGLAQITSLGYGLKMVYDIIYETTVGKISAIGSIIVGAGRAAAQVIRGDFSGAQQSLINGWEQAKARIGVIGDNLVEKANKNMAAMKLAWGFDNRTQGNGFQPDKTGKKWESKPEEDAEDAIKLWSDKAKKIIEIEKDRISTLLHMEKEYLGKLKNEYEEHVRTLDTFYAAYTKIKDSIAARNKKDADDRTASLRGAEDDYQKYYRQLEESKLREIKIDEDQSWTAKSIAQKLEGYNAELELIAKIRDESRTNSINNVSAEQVESDYQTRRIQLEEKINELGKKEIDQLSEAAVKASEAVSLMERGIKAQEDQLKVLDRMIKNIPDITEKTINIKINGIQDLYRIQELTSGVNNNSPGEYYGDYYTMGGKTYWADGTLADNGTSFVEARATGGPVKPYATYRINEDGTEYLTMGDRGGYITPAGKTPPGGSSIDVGGITINLPNVTKVTEAEADQIARMILPKIQQYAKRYA